jgi:hypothetical protein
MLGYRLTSCADVQEKEHFGRTARPTESHSKVGVDKRNSPLPGEGHPAGWVNRIAEKETAAERGTEWRCDAYVLLFVKCLIYSNCDE